MIYEIGIHYTGDTVYDQQVKIPNIPIDKDQRRFWFSSNIIPHWNEDENNTWVKVPVLYNGLNKIYVDDSANRDLSNIDETMIFGDDFNGTTLDTNKWTIESHNSAEQYSISNGGLTISTTNKVDWWYTITNAYWIVYIPYTENTVFRTKISSSNIYSGDHDHISITGYYDSSHTFFYGPYIYVSNVGKTIKVEEIHGTASGDYLTYNLQRMATFPSTYSVYRTNNRTYFKIDDTNVFNTTFNTTTDSWNKIGLYLKDWDTPYGYYATFDYAFIHKYLPIDPVIAYIKPYQRMFHIKNTIFNQSNNVLSYNSQYIETPVIELDNNIQKVDISTINNKTFYYRGSDTQPDITQTGTTSSNTRYWDQNTISNSGWNNTIPSDYIEYKGITNYKYIQYKIPTSY